jgi:hypothetical protein
MVHFAVSSLAESVNWSSDSGVSMREGCDMADKETVLFGAQGRGELVCLSIILFSSYYDTLLLFVFL